MEADERYGAAVLRPLVREPVAPSTVDIGQAIAEGGRRRRVLLGLRAAVAAGCAGAVLLGGWLLVAPQGGSGPAPVPSPQACTLQRLPVPDAAAPKSRATGADPTGRYLVGRWYPTGPQPTLLIWHDGKVRTVAMPGLDPQLRDITSTGIAVGTSYLGPDGEKTVAWLYRDGTLRRLAGEDAEAYAVNEHLAVAGSVGDRPARWSTPDRPPTMLPLPGPGWSGYAAGIDEDGTTVGQVRAGADKPPVGYRWGPDGAGAPLPAPKGDAGYGATAIRAGWVIGSSTVDDVTGTVRWNLSTGTVDTPYRGPASAVNRYGWLVGGADKAVLVTGATTVTLPDLGSTAPVGNDIPVSLSDDGTTIAGEVPLPDGDPVAVVWHCR